MIGPVVAAVLWLKACVHAFVTAQWPKVLNAPLAEVDPELVDIIEKEKNRQYKVCEAPDGGCTHPRRTHGLGPGLALQAIISLRAGETASGMHTRHMDLVVPHATSISATPGRKNCLGQ